MVRDLSVSTNVFWECTVGGTTHNTPPNWSSALGVGVFDPYVAPDTVVEVGGVTWKAVSSGYGTGGGFWIADGANVIWACRCAPLINIRAHAVSVKRCRLFGANNAGIHVQSYPDGFHGPISNCNGFYFENLQIIACGLGIATRGVDSQAGYGCMIDVEGAGYYQGGTGGVAIWDGSFLGSAWVACQTASSTGPGYISGGYDTDDTGIAIDGASVSTQYATWLACYSEQAHRNIAASTANVVLGGASDHPWLGSGRRILGSWETSNIGTWDVFSAKQARALLATEGSDQLYLASNEDNSTPSYYYGLCEYEAPALARSGWWSQTHGAQYPGLSFSGLTASEGRGWSWLPIGEFRGGTTGSFGGQYFHGTDASTLIHARVRNFGHFLAGDRFDLNRTGAEGCWTGYIVKTGGYRGTPWTAGTLYAQVGAGSPSPSIVEPSTNTSANGVTDAGQKVFKCIRTHTSDALSKPAWSGAVNPGDLVQDGGLDTWYLLGTTPAYCRFGFVDDIATGYTSQSKTDWKDSADTDTATPAAKTRVYARRKTTQTTTSSTGQVVATVGPLTDNATTLIDVVVTGKRSGAHSVTYKLSGTFYRDSAGNATRVGSDDKSSKRVGAAASQDVNLVINTTSVEVQVDPDEAQTWDWAVVTQATEGKS